MKKHNGLISFWKFMFALLILCHHFYAITDGDVKHNLFICGAIGVDFFFIVSGVLLAKTVESEIKKGKTENLSLCTCEFIIHKIKGFYPYLMISFITAIIIRIHYGVYTPNDLIKGMLDLSLLQMIGLPKDGLIGGAWYLSAMTISMAVVYPLQKKLGKMYSCLIGPLLAICIGGYLSYNFESMRNVKLYTGTCYLGLLKGFYQITLGCSVYEISKRIAREKYTRIGAGFLSVIEVLCLGGVIYFNAIYDNVRMYDWLFIMMLVLGIAIAFSEKTLLANWAKNRLFFYLESLSVPIYLNNFTFIMILNYSNTLKQLTWPKRCLIEFCGVICLSMIELPLIHFLKKRNWSRLRRIFIES